MSKRRVFSILICALAAAACLCGCATVRHPAYNQTGRPEWTFDVTQIDESDLPAGTDRSQSYFFLGAESVASATEEAARMGALLNAQQQIKLFLHSHGESVLMHQIRSDKSGGFPLPRFHKDKEVMRFMTLLDIRADAQVAHADPVRWYVEEHRPFWKLFWPLANDSRASRWRAWCAVAVPKPICDGIIDQALSQYRQGAARPEDSLGAPDPAAGDQPAGEAPAQPADEAPLPAAQAQPKGKSYGERVAESASLGVANLFAAPVEILNQPFVYAARQPDDHEVLQFAGFIEGIPVGIVKGALRIVYGAGSLLASPFGLPMIPIVKPAHPELADAVLPL